MKDDGMNQKERQAHQHVERDFCRRISCGSTGSDFISHMFLPSMEIDGAEMMIRDEIRHITVQTAAPSRYGRVQQRDVHVEGIAADESVHGGDRQEEKADAGIEHVGGASQKMTEFFGETGHCGRRIRAGSFPGIRSVSLPALMR